MGPQLVNTKYYGEDRIGDMVREALVADDPGQELEVQLQEYIPQYVLRSVDVQGTVSNWRQKVRLDPSYGAPSGGGSDTYALHLALKMTANMSFRRFDSLQGAYEKFGSLPDNYKK